MKVAFVIVIVTAVFLTMVQAGAGIGTLESRRGEFTALTSTNLLIFYDDTKLLLYS